jgi:phenylalanyl-tRNA synthetase beta chain
MLVGKIGTEVTEKSITDILIRLGFEVSLKNTIYTIKVPSWRATGDVSIAEDIVEEISRHIGYETIQSLPLPGPL